jgi:DUF4097 and DUF4098 domain-containing protein YvlB
MDSFNIRKEIKLVRQVGDTGSIEFIVPTIIPLAGKTVELKIFYQDDVILDKSTTNGTITVQGQKVSISLSVGDVPEKGSFHWTLKIKTQNQITTIGKGTFDIV